MEKAVLTLTHKECEAITERLENTVIKRSCRLKTPFKAFIFCEKGCNHFTVRTSKGGYIANSKVFGECICKKEEKLDNSRYRYTVSDIFVYHKPREIDEFHHPFLYDENNCILCSNTCTNAICDRENCEVFKGNYSFRKLPRIWARIEEWNKEYKPEGEYIKK